MKNIGMSDTVDDRFETRRLWTSRAAAKCCIKYQCL